MNFRVFFVFAFLFECLCSEALVWDKTEVEAPEFCFDQKWEISYPFKNKSTKNVVIRSLQACCDCTTWKIEKMKWAPGELGILRLIFDTKGKIGLQEKRVTIQYEGGETQVVSFHGVSHP